MSLSRKHNCEDDSHYEKCLEAVISSSASSQKFKNARKYLRTYYLPKQKPYTVQGSSKTSMNYSPPVTRRTTAMKENSANNKLNIEPRLASNHKDDI